MTWNIIESSKNEILHEWSIENCQGKDVHEIAKWIQGKHTPFWVQYTHKVKDLEPDERNLGIQVLHDTSVKQEMRP